MKKIKNIVSLILGIIFIVSVLITYGSLIIGIGYGLYLWSTGIALSSAAWTGFLTWMSCLFGGIIGMGISAGIGDLMYSNKKKRK